MCNGLADVVVLARAGLNRLEQDLSGLHCYNAPPPLLVPAPGQGALGIQVRDRELLELNFLHNEEDARCVFAERHVLAALEGGCQLPLGVWISPIEEHYRMVLFLSRDDSVTPPGRDGRVSGRPCRNGHRPSESLSPAFTP